MTVEDDPKDKIIKLLEKIIESHERFRDRLQEYNEFLERKLETLKYNDDGDLR